MSCNYCGKKVRPGASFCTACGRQVAQARGNSNQVKQRERQSVTQDVPRNRDQVIWVLSCKRKLSMFKKVDCKILFMEDKLVLAHLSSKRLKAEKARISQEVKAQHKGIIQRGYHKMGYWAEFHERYNRMPINDILREDPSNILIGYPNISKVLFTGYSESYDDERGTTSSDGRFRLNLVNGGKIQFSHSVDASKDIKNFLQGLFGNRLKYRRS